LSASKLAQLVIEGNIRVGLTAAQPYPQPDAPLSSTDADDRLANHCAILECLKAIAPSPAEVRTRVDLPPSPAFKIAGRQGTSSSGMSTCFQATFKGSEAIKEAILRLQDSCA